MANNRDILGKRIYVLPIGEVRLDPMSICQVTAQPQIACQPYRMMVTDEAYPLIARDIRYGNRSHFAASGSGLPLSFYTRRYEIEQIRKAIEAGEITNEDSLPWTPIPTEALMPGRLITLVIDNPTNEYVKFTGAFMCRPLDERKEYYEAG